MSSTDRSHHHVPQLVLIPGVNAPLGPNDMPHPAQISDDEFPDEPYYRPQVSTGAKAMAYVCLGLIVLSIVWLKS